MNNILAYAASYLLFRHTAYVQRSLLAYSSPRARPSPLQRSYRRKGRRLSLILTACEPEQAPPARPRCAAGPLENLPFQPIPFPIAMKGLNLPTDEKIEALAAEAGFSVGAKVHVRNAPAYTAAPIREFSWCDGQVVAVWMNGACRTPLTELVLLDPEPFSDLITTIDTILASWGDDLARAEQEVGGPNDWIPDYPPHPAEQHFECPAGPRDEPGYELAPYGEESDNQDPTEYPENPADEQRG